MFNTLTWLALSYVPSLKYSSLKMLLTHFQSLEAVFKAAPNELQQLGLTTKQVAAIQAIPWVTVDEDVKWCEQHNCHIVPISSPAYPKILKEIADPPLVLFVLGDPAILATPQIAMVGSRNPSVTGKELAYYFASELSQAGLTITSGLALGIDAASHQGAIAAQGKTLGVIGTGIKYRYPRSNAALYEQVEQYGAVVSEFSPSTPPNALNFPLRNRVISGLSLGVLVVEAALQSGSLITARLAAEQNREVFAIPGSIHNPTARGCHKLLKDGAKLVETAVDVIDELNTLHAYLKMPCPDSRSQQKIDLAPSLQRVLEQIGYEVTAIDVMIARAGLTAGELSSRLLSLELMGYAKAVPGGYIRTR